MTAPEPPYVPVTPPGSPEVPGTGDGGTGPAAVRPPAAAGQPQHHRGRTAGRTVALALLVFVTVVLVLFVVFNTQKVDVSLVFGDVDAPLILALLIAAVLGGLLVGLAGLVLRARRSRKG